MFKNKTFRFSIEISAVALLAILTFSYLSYWQYSRYVEKQAYFEFLEKQTARGQHPLDLGLTDWSSEYHGSVQVRGQFDHAKSMVLMNRSMGAVPGVKLITPLLIDGPEKRSILVDRGFLPYAEFESGWIEKQPPSGEVLVEGIIRPSQEKTFRFAPPETPVADGTFKQTWLRLTVEEMGKQLDLNLLPVSLEQTNTTPPYPLYDEREIISPARHLNYCMQWGGFALFALFLATYAQMQRNPVAPVVKQD